MNKLDLGCGPWKKTGFYGIDCHKDWSHLNSNLKVNADLYHDLNTGIPFADNSIEEIYCSHFLEHVIDPIKLLFEIKRVCKNKSKVEIKVPMFEMCISNLKNINNITFDKINFFPLNINENITIRQSSEEHITAFFPDWFEKNMPKGFIIKRKEYLPKIINENNDLIFELQVDLEVIK